MGLVLFFCFKHKNAYEMRISDWSSDVCSSDLSHISTIHPLMAAKQAASIDHISGGRFVLNVVTGWNRPEMEMFGVAMADHDTRYDMAAEWIEIEIGRAACRDRLCTSV